MGASVIIVFVIAVTAAVGGVAARLIPYPRRALFCTDIPGYFGF